MHASEADGNDRTLQTYNTFVDRYLDRSADKPSTLAQLLLQHVEPGSRVLELGSGPGTDAIALEQSGLTVERTDAAPAFVTRLQELGFPARILNALKDDLGGPYDGIYASAVLLHFTPPELATVLTAAGRATRAGGILAASLKKGDGEEWSQRKMGAPRYFHYWQEQDLQELLESTGWAPMVISETTPEGAAERWISLLARRPSGGDSAPAPD